MRVSRSPKLSEIFPEEGAPSVSVGCLKPLTLGHSVSSPELIPIINVLQQEADAPSVPGVPSPLITLHNTPLASPGATSLAREDDNAASAAFAAAASSSSTLSKDAYELPRTGSHHGVLLRLPSDAVVKRYGRSHSAMSLPVI